MQFPASRAFFFLLSATALLSPGLPRAESAPGSTTLSSQLLHLRSGDVPEWEEYANRTPNGRRWEIHFASKPIAAPSTLFIRQNDVRQDWLVELNGKRLGRLFLMEADLVHTLTVPAGTIRDGTNLLSIVPPKENDDIFIGEIRLDPRPPTDAVGEATLSVEVNDGADGSPLPCRLTLVEQNGTLAPLVAVTNGTPSPSPLAVRPGVAYTGNGKVLMGLPSGTYTAYASRGFEWSVATQHIRIAPNQRHQLAFQLRREVPTAGLVCSDTHVHTLTYSGHGDASLDERMLTLAGEGIELPIATDHNIQVSYAEAARKMGVSTHFTPVTGNEVTTPAGHFNIFPVALESRVPDFRITHWPTLMTSLRATPRVRVVILNHPRNVHSNFQPFAKTNFNAVTGENLRGPEFTFDAMEVLNSSAQQTDYMLVYRDWFALWNRGYRITGVGSSDGHDVSRYIIGQGRTYIASQAPTPAQIDPAEVCSNLVAGHALVSMGLLVQMSVNGRFGIGDLARDLGREVQVGVTVLGPSWVTATNVALFANGVPIRAEPIPALPAASSQAAKRGLKAEFNWNLPRPAHDVHLIAIATGPAVTAPFWAIPRPYQPASTKWDGRVIGSTNPILIDADGDGKFSSAYDYAKGLVAGHQKEPAKLFAALQAFDEAVAAQAASLWFAGNQPATGRDFLDALKGAAPQTQRGFAAYTASRQ